MTQARVVLVTFGSEEEALGVARTLVDERLVACANLLPGIRSIYRWQGRVADDREVLMIAKTEAEHFPALEARIRALHSYEVPEVIALPVEAGSAPYLAWLSSETGTT